MSVTVTDRITGLLARLGIERGHFGAQLTAEPMALQGNNPDRLAALILVGASHLNPLQLAPLAARLLVVAGDHGPGGTAAEATKPVLAETDFLIFENYHSASWSDIAANHTETVSAAMLALLDRVQAVRPATEIAIDGATGEHEAITYRVHGNGPALVLLPMFLATSQWDPLVAALSERYAVVLLGGPLLGGAGFLEARGTDAGFLRPVRALVDLIAPQPGETILDVGCGSGALDRFIARHTGQANPITATDINGYLRREATDLVVREGLERTISFQAANAEALPFADASFDVVLSFTVMEECDADKMLAEMIRVTRPGGRVGVMVRATDMPVLWNLPVSAAIKTRIEAPMRSVAAAGCADVSLYRRFRQAPLQAVQTFPHMMTTEDGDGAIWKFYEAGILASLDPVGRRQWAEAKATAIAEGTLMLARPLHCALGTKPG